MGLLSNDSITGFKKRKKNGEIAGYPMEYHKKDVFLHFSIGCPLYSEMHLNFNLHAQRSCDISMNLAVFCCCCCCCCFLIFHILYMLKPSPECDRCH